METKQNLKESTVDKLQDLIQINIDSQKGFADAAQEIEDKSIASLFHRLGAERSANVAELKKIVSFNGERPRKDGSMLAAMHRAWMSVRSAMSGGDSHAILSEAERGEDAIVDMYKDVLKETAGSAVNDVLTHQLAKVKTGHDEVRDLRDSLAHA